MNNDHLADAILFIHGAIEALNDGVPVSRHDLERAIEEIEIQQRLDADRRTLSTSDCVSEK